MKPSINNEIKLWWHNLCHFGHRRGSLRRNGIMETIFCFDCKFGEDDKSIEAMKNMVRKMILLILTLMLCGCDKHSDNTVDLGNYISSTPLATSFNESDKTVLHTDKGDYILIGFHSFNKNEKVLIRKKYIIKETR